MTSLTQYKNLRNLTLANIQVTRNKHRENNSYIHPLKPFCLRRRAPERLGVRTGNSVNSLDSHNRLKTASRHHTFCACL